jgi:metallo-beta-lactamase class B
MNRLLTIALAAFATGGVAAADAQPAADTIDAHLKAARKAAGMVSPQRKGGTEPGYDWPGILAALCVAPATSPAPKDVTPDPPPPDRARWYTEPAKVFDDLYFVGTKDRSAWLLPTSEGFILIDTSFEYEAEEVIVGGLKKLGFDPAIVKYVIITHAHDGEVGGAKLMQDRFGSRIVMGGGDWDMIEGAVNLYPNGKPRRDIVAQDGQKITLGGRSVTLVLNPGHTPGTVSLIFDVKDNGRPLTVALAGGTEFNFVNDVPHFDTYIASARKMEAAAAAANATVLMSNQSEYDNAYLKIRMLASRRPGESHPLEVGADGVKRYFQVFDECAQVARLKLLAGGK